MKVFFVFFLATNLLVNTYGLSRTEWMSRVAEIDRIAERTLDYSVTVLGSPRATQFESAEIPSATFWSDKRTNVLRLLSDESGNRFYFDDRGEPFAARVQERDSMSDRETVVFFTEGKTDLVSVTIWKDGGRTEREYSAQIPPALSMFAAETHSLAKKWPVFFSNLLALPKFVR